MNLIPNAANAHKFWCVWAAFGIIALNIATALVPALHLQPDTLAAVNAALAGAVIALRVLKQQGILTAADVPGLDEACKTDVGAAPPANTQK